MQDYGPEPWAPLLALLAEVLGLCAGGLAIWLVVRRPGLAFRGREAVAAATVAVLLAISIFYAWDSSRALNKVRQDQGGGSEGGARGGCTVSRGIPPALIEWLADRIPSRERYYMAVSPPVRRVNGQVCTAMLLLPRLLVDDPADARYLVLAGAVPPGVGAELSKPGNEVFTFKRGYFLIRRP